MSDDVKRPVGDARPPRGGSLFRIREFLDLRRIREACGESNGKPCVMDLSDGAIVVEEDFALRRSTPDEGWLFYRESLGENKGEGEDGDELTEFLNDR